MNVKDFFDWAEKEFQKEMKLMRVKGEEYTVSDTSEAKTTLYFNADDTVVTEGDCIYTLQTAHKKIEIFQMQK